MPNRQSYYIQMDFILLLLFFMIVSLLAIFNAQQLPQYDGENFMLKQAVWFIVGIGAVATIQFLDLDQLYKASMFIYGFGVLLLIALLISPESIARTINNTKSWFTFPGLSLQPAEFTKISTILFLSAVISRHKSKYETSTLKSDSFLLVKICLITALPVFFILQQPDFGTSMVYLFIAGVMVILSGVDWKVIISLALAGILLAAGMLGLIVKFPEASQEIIGIEPYQIDRIMTWFDSSEQSSSDTYHFDLSLLALGSGQLVGKGIDNLQVEGLPEAHTDFIFSIIGESFGFIGCAIVIFLYFLLLYKLVTLGLNSFNDNSFGSYLCFGYLSLLLVHAFQNMGMTIGIMPITGIPLLLVSYGGSSVLSAMIGFGLVYRVAVEHSIQRNYLFK